MKKLDLTKPEPLLTNTQPVGTNTLTSRASFFQRKLYEVFADSNAITANTQPIDFWYEKIFYGRVNALSRPVHISEGFLKQIVGTPDLFLVNFAADAFQDFMKQMDFIKSRGGLEAKSSLANLTPVKAWTSVNSLYHGMMVSLFEKLKSHITDNRLDGDIKDFRTFTSVFIKFVNVNTPLVPFTRSKLVVSRLANPRSSGLIVELSEESHAVDKVKVESYLQDPNFPLFKETAQRFGFVVDLHAPWRLVADLGSPAMKPYMEAYKITTENLFERYYYTSYKVDLEALKSYIVQFYNSYVSGNRVFVEPEFSYDKTGRVIVINKETIRETTTKKEVEDETSDEFWLRMYTFIRGREDNKAWSQSDFEKVVRNAFLLSKGLDFSKAIQYIDRRTHSPSGSSRKERGFRFINSQRLT